MDNFNTADIYVWHTRKKGTSIHDERRMTAILLNKCLYTETQKKLTTF